MSVEAFNEFRREEGEPEIPMCWEICSTCRGEGTSTAYLGDVTEWLREDPDAWEDYFGGIYDRTCDDCGGTGKVRAVDYTRASHQQLDDFYEYANEIAEMHAIEAMERRMGA